MNLDDPEVRKVTSVNSVVNNSLKYTDYLMTYFTDWKRLKVSVAWFLRLKAILLELSSLRKGLTASDNAQACQMERLKATITQRRNVKRPVGSGAGCHLLFATAKVSG